MSTVPPANHEPLICNDETMRYRPLGRTGLMVSALSFGCMRLSEDRDLNTALIARAIELGVNYFETTRGYCQGQCQQRTAPGLVGRSAGVIVSGKAGIQADTTAYGFRKEIERQLDILGLSHFKFFQVGWFGWDRVAHLLKPGGVIEALRQAQTEGLVHHIGFTGHDKPENFTRILETGLFDSITVPYNLVNRAYEPTIRRAGELGVGVVAMCPVAGGTLTCDSAALKEALGMDLPTAEMALRFVLANPAVSTACSGMSTLAQLEQNAPTVKAFDPAGPALFERLCGGLDRLRERLGHRLCTGCRYCLPCAQGVDIPHHLELHRLWRAFDLAEVARNGLRGIPPANRLERCNSCGECEKKCPNEIPVRETLRELATLT